MILVTGDTHRFTDFKKLKSPTLSHLTKEDYLIIVGDCGVLFFPNTDKEAIEEYNALPFTVLFVDGNHENFDALYAYPVEMWNGGKVHRLASHVIHLMRGQVFEIEGKTFFTFGGGLSIDKAYREPHVSWWPQELPTEEEIQEGLSNLAKHKNKVDFVLTHDCPSSLLSVVGLYSFKAQGGFLKFAKSNEALERIYAVLDFTHWYFGHYHIDQFFTEKFTCLYQDVIQILP